MDRATWEAAWIRASRSDSASDRHAERLSCQPTYAIRYLAVFAGDELPLLEVMEEAMHG